MCLRAWNDLSSERQIGFGGVGPIPQSAVLAWAQRKGFDEETTDVLWTVIRRLDRDRAVRAQSKADLEAASKGAGK